MISARPGDVLAVYGGDGWFNKLIRLGSWLRRKSDVSTHVVIVTHYDGDKWMGIEGRPSSVGPVDCTGYLDDPRTRSNNAQPRPDDAGQLSAFLDAANKTIGTPYDWVAIAGDAFEALGRKDALNMIDSIWRWPKKPGVMPDHVVCSSLAAALYALVGWAHPGQGSERNVAPCDWWMWSDTAGWK